MPIYERMHGMQRQIDRVQGRQEWNTETLQRLERDLASADNAIEAIKSKMSGAILWLAIGAGGLLLKLIGPKFGL